MKNKSKSSVSYFLEILNTSITEESRCIDVKAHDLYMEYIRFCWEISTIPKPKNVFYKEVVSLNTEFYLDRNKCRVFKGVGSDINYITIKCSNKLSRRGKLILALIGYGPKKISEALEISYTAAYNRLSGVVDFSEDDIKKLKRGKLL